MFPKLVTRLKAVRFSTYPLILIIAASIMTFLLSITPVIFDIIYNLNDTRKLDSEFYKRLHVYVMPGTAKDYKVLNTFAMNESIWREINATIFPRKREIIAAESRDLIAQCVGIAMFLFVAAAHVTYGRIILSKTSKLKRRHKFLSKHNIMYHGWTAFAMFCAMSSYFVSLVFLNDRNYMWITDVMVKVMKVKKINITFHDANLRHYCSLEFHEESESVYREFVPYRTRMKLEEYAYSTKMCAWTGFKLSSLSIAAIIACAHAGFTLVLAAYTYCCRRIQLPLQAHPAFEFHLMAIKEEQIAASQAQATLEDALAAARESKSFTTAATQLGPSQSDIHYPPAPPPTPAASAQSTQVQVKVMPKVTTMVTDKATAMVTDKATAMVTDKVTPKVTDKGAPKVIPKVKVTAPPPKVTPTSGAGSAYKPPSTPTKGSAKTTAKDKSKRR